MSLRAAVIGIGSMGKNHMRVLREIEGVELVAVSDLDNSLLEAAKKKYKVTTYSSYKKLLDNENIDLISIVVPTRFHKEVALYCISKKVNVLLEKPIAASVEEAKEIIAAAKEHNVLLTIGHLERFNSAILKLQEFLKEKKLGKIYKIEAVRAGPYPVGRIKDAGVVIDLAVHDLDIFNMLIGKKVKRVYAETEKKIHTTNEDVMLALIKFEDGVLGVIDVNWLTPTKIRKLRVMGEKGMFEVDYIAQSLIFYENATKLNLNDTMFAISEGKVVKHFIAKREPLYLEIEAFVKCVKNNVPPIVSGEDGLEALKLVEKIITSANNKEVVLYD